MHILAVYDHIASTCSKHWLVESKRAIRLRNLASEISAFSRFHSVMHSGTLTIMYVTKTQIHVLSHINLDGIPIPPDEGVSASTPKIVGSAPVQELKRSLRLSYNRRRIQRYGI